MILLLFIVSLVHAASQFSAFSTNLLDQIHNCHVSQYYIKKAEPIEKSNEANRERSKITMYHGYFLGNYIAQLLLKQFMFKGKGQVPADFLPLRVDNRKHHEITKEALASQLRSGSPYSGNPDHDPFFKEYALSTSVNLISTVVGESPMVNLCRQNEWYRLGGVAGEHDFLDQIIDRYIPSRRYLKNLWNNGVRKLVKKQFNAILYFIQLKRNLPPIPNHATYDFKKLFPKHKLDLHSSKNKPPQNGDNVILQITINSNVVDRIAYPAHPMGLVYQLTGRLRTRFPKQFYKNDRLAPFLDFYNAQKNNQKMMTTKDPLKEKSARIALNDWFTTPYHNQVHIKPITTLHEDVETFNLVEDLLRYIVKNACKKGKCQN